MSGSGVSSSTEQPPDGRHPTATIASTSRSRQSPEAAHEEFAVAAECAGCRCWCTGGRFAAVSPSARPGPPPRLVGVGPPRACRRPPDLATPGVQRIVEMHGQPYCAGPRARLAPLDDNRSDARASGSRSSQVIPPHTRRGGRRQPVRSSGSFSELVHVDDIPRLRRCLPASA